MKRIVVLFCLLQGCLSLSALEKPSTKRRIIVDSLKRQVAIPEQISRILSLEPEITRIIIALGGGDKLVGIDYFMRRHDHLFRITFPKGAGLPGLANAAASVNIETAVGLNPDIVFTPPEDFDLPEALERKMKTPVVALSSMGSIQKLLEEIMLIGDAIGRSDRAAELIAYFKSKSKALGDTVASVPLKNKPRVYLSFWSSFNKTPVIYEPVSEAGGRNLAEGLMPSFMGAVSAVVKLEQIVSWNPDVILIHGNIPPKERMVTTEGVLSDSRLSSIRAVQNGKVFYTFGFWNWWDPAEVLLETLFLARLFHPKIFSGFDFEREGTEIFRMFYGIDDGFKELSRVLKCDEWLKN